MYLHICPHKHTHTISFFHIYNKKIFKITFLKLKIQELFQALTHSASAFSFQQTKFEVTLCGGGGGYFVCGGGWECKCADFVDCKRED